MNDKERDVIRTALEMQFRYKFYQDTVFPYLQSLGVKDVFQGFGSDETGWLGMIHLWWVPEESNIHYDNPKNWPVKIIGVWKSEWFDTAKEGMEAAQKVEEERNKIYDTNKMFNIHHEYVKSITEKQIKRQIKEKLEEEIEEPDKKILWN